MNQSKNMCSTTNSELTNCKLKKFKIVKSKNFSMENQTEPIKEHGFYRQTVMGLTVKL